MQVKLRKYLMIISLVVLSIPILPVYSYLIAMDSIKNTFYISDLLEDSNIEFYLKEHIVQDKDIDGDYELGQEEVLENNYVVFPGINIPKDPFIRIVNLDESVYLYIEVVGSSSNDFSWSVNSNWLETTLIGKNGGKVYAYKGISDEVQIIDEDIEVYILSGIDGSENGGILVADNFSSEESIKLDLYGYLTSADNFENYIEAFENSF